MIDLMPFTDIFLKFHAKIPTEVAFVFVLKLGLSESDGFRIDDTAWLIIIFKERG
jgi:hypothetical protein